MTLRKKTKKSSCRATAVVMALMPGVTSPTTATVVAASEIGTVNSQIAKTTVPTAESAVEEALAQQISSPPEEEQNEETVQDDPGGGGQDEPQPDTVTEESPTNNDDTQGTSGSPTEPIDTPADPTDAPEEPTQEPDEPVAEPTEAPAEPTDIPVEPTEAPAEPTDIPTETTPGPTQAPTAVPTETPGIAQGEMTVVSDAETEQKTQTETAVISAFSRPAPSSAAAAPESQGAGDVQSHTAYNDMSYVYIPPATNRSTAAVTRNSLFTVVPKKYLRVSTKAKVYGYLNVRESTSLTSRVVGALYPGAVFYDLGEITPDDGTKWHYIEALDTHGNIIRGYASSDFVESLPFGTTPKEDWTKVKRFISESYNNAFFDTYTTTQSVLLKVENRSGIRDMLLKYAEQFLGNPYVWGGEDLVNGTDCSGYTRGIYRHFGYELPRCSYEQAEVGTKIPYEEAQPGDLIFYMRDGRVYHVMIYYGNGQVIHASSSTTGIIISSVNVDKVCWAVRIINDIDADTTPRYLTSSKAGSTQASDLVSTGRLAYMGDASAQQKIIEQLAAASETAMRETGFKRSILIAQAIQESGWVSFSNPVDGGIVPEDNNILGMNEDLNGHPMTYASGAASRIVPQWNGYEDVWGAESMRVYEDIESCFTDFASFRMNKHPELQGMTDYDDYLHLAVLGYATDPTYEASLRQIISQYGLTQYDVLAEEEPVDYASFTKESESAAQGDQRAQREVIKALKEVTSLEFKSCGIAPSLLIADAISGDWCTNAPENSNNIYGVEADEEWTGDTVDVMLGTTGRRQFSKTLKVYDSLTDAVIDYAETLKDGAPELVGLVDPSDIASRLTADSSFTELYAKYNLGTADKDPMFLNAQKAGAGTTISTADHAQYTQEDLELIWAIVAQEDDGSYEGALAVISSAMNRADTNYGAYGTTALEQLTADGQYCYSPKVSDPSLWQRRLGGNVPEFVKQAVEDCLTKGIRNNEYLNFRSSNRTGDYVQIGGNWYF